MDLFVGIDFETANPKRLSACSVGLAIPRESGRLAGRYDSARHILLSPPAGAREFNRHNVRVHGIRASDCFGAPEFPAVYKAMGHVFDDDRFVFAAHNAPFDHSVLRALCEHYGLPMPGNRWVDTVKTARRALPDLVNHRLPTVSTALGLGEFSHHNAAEDALMTAAIATLRATDADEYRWAPRTGRQ